MREGRVVIVLGDSMKLVGVVINGVCRELAGSQASSFDDHAFQRLYRVSFCAAQVRDLLIGGMVDLVL